MTEATVNISTFGQLNRNAEYGAGRLFLTDIRASVGHIEAVVFRDRDTRVFKVCLYVAGALIPAVDYFTTSRDDAHANAWAMVRARASEGVYK